GVPAGVGGGGGARWRPNGGGGAARVGGAGGAKVPLERSAAEEVSDRELVEDRHAEVATGPQRDDGGVPARAHDQPAKPECGAERLAGGAEVGGAVGVRSLQGTAGPAGVPRPGVVRTFQAQAVASASPRRRG